MMQAYSTKAIKPGVCPTRKKEISQWHSGELKMDANYLFVLLQKKNIISQNSI